MNKFFNFIIWPIIAGLVFAFTLLQLPNLANRLPGLSTYISNPAPLQIIQTASISYSDAYRKASPAVVSINAHQSLIEPIITEESQLYKRTLYDENSLGSGVVIRSDGYIITSYHIIATQLNNTVSTITLSDGRELEARPVMMDEINDLALLKIEAENLPFISIGNQSDAAVGDIVLAIGNPRNIGKSVTMGIISAIFRLGDTYVIQTDADLNPGNSGGALIDVNGDLIGINSTIISESGGSEGIGFATPASKASALLQRYLESKSGGYLGVSPIPITQSKGLILYGTAVQGILVNRVILGSPAEDAGILSGDIIIGANGRNFNMENESRLSEAVNYIGSAGPGQVVMLEIFRNHDILEIPVTLTEGKPIQILPDQ